MTDRELLEAAARAAGIELADFQSGLPGQPLWMARGQENPETGSRDWNPLASDGDALRLAVKLKISISYDLFSNEKRGAPEPDWMTTVDFILRPGMKPCDIYEAYGDPMAATRRAIVLAAASIGKTGEPT